MKFKKAGTRDFIDYQGDRSLESLVAFVEENAANPLDKSVPFGSNDTVPQTEPEQVVFQTEHDHDEL